jgi:hypothetical protein
MEQTMISEPNYEVEAIPGSVRINLGGVPGFTVPRATAVKLALLLLARAGHKVTMIGNEISVVLTEEQANELFN